MNHLEFRKNSIDGVKPNPKLLGLAVVEVNPTELCNRTCSFCPRHDPAIYPNRNLHMSIDTARRLNEQLITNNFNGYICIAGYGEPLLNPNIRSIINELKDQTLELITNADPILKGKFTVDELLQMGVDRILISDYDSNEALKELERQYPQVRVRRYIDDGEDRYEEYGFNNRAGTMFSVDAPIARPCYIPSYKAMVDWNGNILLCSHDWSKKYVFGNILEQDVSDIWMSQAFIRHRVELSRGNRHMFESCAKCNVKGDIMGEQYADMFINSM